MHEPPRGGPPGPPGRDSAPPGAFPDQRRDTNSVPPGQAPAGPGAPPLGNNSFVLLIIVTC